MNPVVIYRDEATVKYVNEEISQSRDKASEYIKHAFPPPAWFCPHFSSLLLTRDLKHPFTDSATSRADFLQYVDQLLESSKKSSHPAGLYPTRRESDTYVDPAKSRKTCANTVYSLTKSGRKGSVRLIATFFVETVRFACLNYIDMWCPFLAALFDICKSNERVAQLQLTKTSYRLGETLTGIINFAGCAVTSYQVTITLESSEAVEPSAAMRPVEQILRISRRTHAEHHESCLNTRRTAFALPIPLTGSPDFTTTGVRLQWHLRIEFVTGTDEPFVAINTDDRHRHYQAIQDVEVSSFDCLIPVKMYPGGQERTLFNSSHTFVVM
ncbi:reduced growth phenotype protein 1 [Jimgerdemannia flammicorona]|uniref:Reduced growth phenotype protein 1 n=1 Tax=Jimgerdemannia flammicorona TaxID=994334 RepID=A0A433PK15_9FUNG|nr:reduced growth phenotype protein 1 [Jimgerdemannia flammicorona]